MVLKVNLDLLANFRTDFFSILNTDNSKDFDDLALQRVFMLHFKLGNVIVTKSSPNENIS